MKKILLIIFAVIGIVAALCGLQYAMYYYSHPMTEEVHITTTGCLIFGTDVGNHKLVPVEIRGQSLKYIFHNKEDGIQGDVWVNGKSLFGSDKNDEVINGFYTEFFEETGYTACMNNSDGLLGRLITLPGGLDGIMCSVNAVPDISGTASPPEGIPALLAAPADNIEDALKIVKDAASQLSQTQDWLIENGWSGLIVHP